MCHHPPQTIGCMKCMGAGHVTTLLLILCSLWIRFGTGYEDEEASCQLNKNLRDKWIFSDRWTRNFVRIRRHVFIYFDKESGVKLRFLCTEKRGNIYLLTTDGHPTLGDRGVLCVGFTYLGERPLVEYAIIRLNSNGDKHELVSPNLIPPNTTVSIDKTCDLVQNQRSHKIFAFFKRVGPGCKFPHSLRSSWQCTDMSSMLVSFSANRMTYTLTNGTNVSMVCEKRDLNTYLLRIKKYAKGKDAILCAQITKLRVEEDNKEYDYDYEILRLNSGTAFEGKLKIVPAKRKVNIHQICDWINSPARPEYLYARKQK